MDAGTAATFGTLVLAGVGAVGTGVYKYARLEARIGAHDQLFTERQAQSNDRHDDIVNRLERIEAKIDRNGSK